LFACFCFYYYYLKKYIFSANKSLPVGSIVDLGIDPHEKVKLLRIIKLLKLFYYLHISILKHA